MALAGVKINTTDGVFPIRLQPPASGFVLSRVSVGFEPTFSSLMPDVLCQLYYDTLFFLVVTVVLETTFSSL